MTTSVDTARIIFAGGGTGGHLFPAIAIANRVSELMRDKRPVDIIFVGTKRGLEYRMREALGYPLHIINMRGIARTLTLKNLLVPFVVVVALVKASMLVSRFRPDLVIGTGGYVCWPVLKVAAAKNIPTLLQEQNSFPGVTIRQLAGRARKIYLGFEKAREYLKTNAELIATGNPVRKNITSGDRMTALKKFNLDPARKTILVLGGSQGATAINQAVLKSIDNDRIDPDMQILWQTGKRDYTEVADKAGHKASICSLFPFAQDMEQVYAAADIVVARAGALTLAEITACGLPAILIPYPYAAGDHQRKNAMDYVTRGMAELVDESELAGRDIITGATALLRSDKYQQMKTAIRRETDGRTPAVDVIAEDIVRQIETIKETGVRG